MKCTKVKTPLGSILLSYKFLHKKTTIHTYISPYEAFANATHIIEGPKYLVLIDPQYLKIYAKEFRKIADGLGKEIAGMIISHAHPDHIFGVDAAFRDIGVYALPSVINFLKENKDNMIKENKKTMGNKIANNIIIPDYELNVGDVVIDGNLFRYSKIYDAESHETLVIELPELNVLIPQDLVSSGMHLWLTKDMKHWISILKKLKKNKSTLILSGHGLPIKPNHYNFIIKYLTYANNLIKKYDSIEIYKKLIKEYPKLKGREFITMSLSHM